MKYLSSLALLPLAAPPPQDAPLPGADALVDQIAAAGIGLDLEAGLLAFDVEVTVRNELLEYLLVASYGAAHESLFATGVDAEILNTAFLLLGLEPGKNASFTQKPVADGAQAAEPRRDSLGRPQPTEFEWETALPEGDPLYLYAAWREGEEEHFFRVEDLVRDLSRGRTMRRRPFVYLGSRMVQRGLDGGETVFAAGAEGNYINLAFFAQGNTLVTAALEECVEQTIWLPNAWLLPERGSKILLVAARHKLETLTPELRRRQPAHPPASREPVGGKR